MRILFVAGRFSQQQDAASINNRRVANELARRGHEIIVFTVGPNAAHGAGELDVDRSIVVQHARAGATGIRRVLRRGLFAAGRRIPALTRIPDRFLYWHLFSGSEAQQLCAAYQPDVIYSRSDPFSSHLVARRLASRTRMPWVAHFGDPLTGSPYNSMGRLVRRRNRGIERRIYEAATRLIFTNQVQLDFMVGRHAADIRSKAHVVPPFFDSRELEPNGAAKDIPRAAGPLIAHVGRLYQRRSPESLLHALALMNESGQLPPGARMAFVGATRPAITGYESRDEFGTAKLARELGLDEIVWLVGEVPYWDSIGWMKAADVLVSIDAAIAGQSPFLPSKLVSYAAAGRPLVNLSTADSASAQFIDQVGGVTVSPSDPKAIACCLGQVLQSLVATDHRFVPNAGALAEFEIGFVIDRLERLLGCAERP